MQLANLQVGSTPVVDTDARPVCVACVCVCFVRARCTYRACVVRVCVCERLASAHANTLLWVWQAAVDDLQSVEIKTDTDTVTISVK